MRRFFFATTRSDIRFLRKEHPDLLRDYAKYLGFRVITFLAILPLVPFVLLIGCIRWLGDRMDVVGNFVGKWTGTSWLMGHADLRRRRLYQEVRNRERAANARTD